MASKLKHKQRSQRSYHTNRIPAYMFAHNAQKNAEMKFYRNMLTQSAEGDNENE